MPRKGSSRQSSRGGEVHVRYARRTGRRRLGGRSGGPHAPERSTGVLRARLPRVIRARYVARARPRTDTAARPATAVADIAVDRDARQGLGQPADERGPAPEAHRGSSRVRPGAPGNSQTEASTAEMRPAGHGRQPEDVKPTNPHRMRGCECRRPASGRASPAVPARLLEGRGSDGPDRGPRQPPRVAEKQD